MDVKQKLLTTKLPEIVLQFPFRVVFHRVAIGLCTVATLLVTVCVAYRVWCYFSFFELEAKTYWLLRRFDAQELDLDEETSEASAECQPTPDKEGDTGDDSTDGGDSVYGGSSSGNSTVKPPKANTRWQRNRKQTVAFALANKAYRQFGHRPRSEANMLITRKYMRDELEEIDDLRDRSAAEIIDRALYLSFLPSLTLREMNEMDGTYAFNARSADKPGLLSWWWWPFHRAKRA